MLLPFGNVLLTDATLDSAGLSDGRVALVSLSGSTLSVTLRSADGMQLGSSIVLDDSFSPIGPHPAKIVALEDGRFAVAWMDDTHVRWSVYERNGTLAGQGVAPGGMRADRVSLSPTVDGGFSLTWTDAAFDDKFMLIDGDGVQAQDAPTSLGGRGMHFTSAAVDSGSIVVFVESTFIVKAVFLDSEGNTGDSPRTVSFTGPSEVFTFSRYPAVASAPNGNILVAWQDTNGDGMVTATTGLTGIRYRLLAPDGTALTSELSANITSPSRDEQVPDVVALRDGRFVIAWTDTAGSGVYARLIDSTGAPLVAEITVATSAASGVSMSETADGRLLFSWKVVDGDTVTSESRFFDPRTQALTLESTDLDENFIGTTFADTFDTGGGNDWVNGWLGDDSIDGGDGLDTLLGEAGNDELFGFNGNDSLVGGAGNDRLNGDIGADTMVGGRGNDTYQTDQSGDRVIETRYGGTDTIQSRLVTIDLRQFSWVENAELGGRRDLNLIGSDTSARLIGNVGNNIIIGQGGAETINGGAGNDTITSGLGRDVITGGTGADAFSFNYVTAGRGNRADRIEDFTTSVDTIRLSGLRNAVWLEGGDFSGDQSELMYQQSTGILSGDVNGDGTADFHLRLGTGTVLLFSDIVLV